MQIIDERAPRSPATGSGAPTRRSGQGAASQRVGLSLAADVLERLRSRIGHWRLPDNLIEELFGHHALLTYSKGALIFPQDSPAEVIFLIHKGLVNLYSYQADGSRVLVRLAGVGEIIGYANILDQKGRPLHALEAAARTSCQFAMVTREHLGAGLQGLDSRTLVKLIETLNAVWSGEMLRWANCVPRDCQHRLQLVFADLAYRLGVRDARGIVLLPELSHLDLAEMTGCSRPMASRVIAQMLKQGILARQEGRYIVPAGSAIEAMLPDYRPSRS
jgi:CRP/FNR family transcriptional regulator